MANSFIKGLYDMAGKEDNNGINKFDEQKFRKALDSNEGLLTKNRDNFRRGESKFSTCLRYAPCAICDKCLNKASHLYVSCQNCLIPICVHTHKDRSKMIRRENFKVFVSDKTILLINELIVKAESIREERRLNNV